MVLKWTIEREGITIALADARNAQQSEQNAKAIDISLTEDEIDFINDEMDKL